MGKHDILKKRLFKIKIELTMKWYNDGWTLIWLKNEYNKILSEINNL